MGSSCGSVSEGETSLPSAILLVRQDFPPERQPVCRGHADGCDRAAPRTTMVRGSIRAASSPLGAMVPSNRDKNIRLDGPQTPEPVLILRLDAPKRRAFKNRVHRGRALW